MTFLKILSAVLGLLGTAYFCYQNNEIEVPSLAAPNEKIIVIGAGMAGLTAAKMLHSDGFDVTILEARDRIGGRSYTKQVGGGWVDLGGAWLTNPKGNPLSKIVKANNLKLAEASSDKIHLFVEKLPNLSEPEKMNYLTIFLKIAAQLDEAMEEVGEEATAEDAIQFMLDNNNLKGDERLIIESLVRSQIEIDYASAARHLGVSGFEAADMYSGEEELIVGGFKTIVDLLQEGLDIQLSQVVTGIDYSKDEIIISTQKGEKFSCNKVIITVPIGVLKKGSIQFTPLLPSSKQEVINNMGTGNLEKVIFTFDKKFWKNMDMAAFVATESQRFPSIFDLTDATGVPTLAFLYAGDFSDKLQKNYTDEQITKEAIDVLKKIFEMEIPKPKEVICTHWSTDPFTLGSYAYLKVGGSEKAIKELAKPIQNKVFFAGEATEPNCMGYVHGAMLTGIREAKRLGASGKGIKGLENFKDTRY